MVSHTSPRLMLCSIMFTFYHLHTVLVACNGFPSDFISLVTKVKHHKLNEIFNITLTHSTYNVERVSCNICA